MLNNSYKIWPYKNRNNTKFDNVQIKNNTTKYQ